MIETEETNTIASAAPSADQETTSPATPVEEATTTHTASAKKNFLSLLAIVFCVGFSQLFAFLADGVEDPLFAGSGMSVAQVTIFVAMLIQIVAFVPAFYYQTEHYYDITGSFTYILCTVYSYVAGLATQDYVVNARTLIPTILTVVWAARLGSFLYKRVKLAGKDARFDKIKPDPLLFLAVWTLQGLWVTLTAIAVFTLNSSPPSDLAFPPTVIIGLVVWVGGFGCEAMSDRQKRIWRADTNNRGKWIAVGLWYYSRHPNYFGEITLWVGMFITCCSSFVETQWAAAVGPIFVYCLITYVSGVPMLERYADKKWGDVPAYQDYKKSTNCLVPWFKR